MNDVHSNSGYSIFRELRNRSSRVNIVMVIYLEPQSRKHSINDIEVLQLSIPANATLKHPKLRYSCTCTCITS